MLLRKGCFFSNEKVRFGASVFPLIKSAVGRGDSATLWTLRRSLSRSPNGVLTIWQGRFINMCCLGQRSGGRAGLWLSPHAGCVCVGRRRWVGGLFQAPSPGTRQRTHTRQITILNVMQSQDTPIWETHEIPAWPFNVLRDRGHVLNRDRLSATSRPLSLRVPSTSFVARIVAFQSGDGPGLRELTPWQFISLTSFTFTHCNVLSLNLFSAYWSLFNMYQ